MCGIFGVALSRQSTFSFDLAKNAFEKLFKLSESRGREASGVIMRTSQSCYISKAAEAPRTFLKSDIYQRNFDNFLNEVGSKKNEFFSLVGHARLATNGVQAVPENNQPVRRGTLVGVHNGIIVNVENLWANHNELERTSELDTEVMLAMMDSYKQKGYQLDAAFKRTVQECEGAINAAIFDLESSTLLLGGNVGSLYVVVNEERGGFFFASERTILRELCGNDEYAVCEHKIRHVNAGYFLTLNIDSLDINEFSLQQTKNAAPDFFVPTESAKIIDSDEVRKQVRSALRRCTKCVLPETVPFIEFDEEGVCNFCRSYNPIKLKPKEELKKRILQNVKKRQDADCIVAFSGGRDSSYALHYLVEELGVKAMAYSYDWGMITDLGRRNQARLTGKLGVEHILISADIGMKRRNIRKNLMAWLKRPNLGMIPLLIAGDKHFFHYANMLQKKTGIEASVWSANQLERTQFKVGFCGVNTFYDAKEKYVSAISNSSKMKMTQFYMNAFLRNPAYLNSSLFDTAKGYFSYYWLNKDYVQFYEYIPWNETEVEHVLLNEYDWELAPDTQSTWRIGDGTAAFYNYVYHHVAGFTENDTFRSNQIREGNITREEALALVKRDNQPRYDSIKEYLDLIQVNMNDALRVIHNMDTLYDYP